MASGKGPQGGSSSSCSSNGSCSNSSSCSCHSCSSGDLLRHSGSCADGSSSSSTKRKDSYPCLPSYAVDSGDSSSSTTPSAAAAAATAAAAFLRAKRRVAASSSPHRFSRARLGQSEGGPFFGAPMECSHMPFSRWEATHAEQQQRAPVLLQQLTSYGGEEALGGPPLFAAASAPADFSHRQQQEQQHHEHNTPISATQHQHQQQAGLSRQQHEQKQQLERLLQQQLLLYKQELATRSGCSKHPYRPRTVVSCQLAARALSDDAGAPRRLGAPTSRREGLYSNASLSVTSGVLTDPWPPQVCDEQGRGPLCSERGGVRVELEGSLLVLFVHAIMAHGAPPFAGAPE
ncbi:hypothetical protein Esti_006396 [Eimeria stiedai]